jgi:hypothetical protein
LYDYERVPQLSAKPDYSFPRGIWASVSGTYYTGGTSTVGGVNQHDLEENYRVGAALSMPLGRRESIKLYGSDGVFARTGSNFWLLGIGFRYQLLLIVQLHLDEAAE